MIYFSLVFFKLRQLYFFSQAVSESTSTSTSTKVRSFTVRDILQLPENPHCLTGNVQTDY